MVYIFAGSYERFIFGYSASADCSQPQEVVKRYTFAAHQSGVKCMAASGPYVASGGSDDTIHLYDMKAERDLGMLLNPCDGAVPCLEFFTPEGRSVPSHMLGGSADGAINIWRCKGWEHLKVMRGHKGAVNSIAVHGSGKLALSTARDGAIRMWNLAKGRCTYTAKLEAEAEQVAFSASGDAYSLLCGNRITVHSAGGEGGLLAAYTAPRRILCCASQSDDLMLLGLEDGSVRLWDVRTSAPVRGWERAHASRVRGMAILQKGYGKVPSSLVTCSSDGSIKLWDTRMLGGPGPGASGAGTGGAGAGGGAAVCTAEVATNARLTCLAAVDPDAVAPPGSGSGSGPQAAVGKGGAKAEGKQGGASPAGAKNGGKGGADGKQAAAKAGPGAGKAAAAAAGKAAKAGQAQAPQKPQQKQQQGQQQRPGKPQQQAPRPKPQQQQRGGGRGGGGRGGGGRGGGGPLVDDDPGFEIVPAPRYAGDAENGAGAGAGRPKQRKAERREPAAGAGAGSGAGAAGKGKKRPAAGDAGEDDGPAPSGRKQQGQAQGRGQGQKGAGKVQGQAQGQGRGVGGKGAGQPPAKKAKVGAGAGGPQPGGRGPGGAASKGNAGRGGQGGPKPGKGGRGRP
ncbi:hypothetical protein HYH03_017637 [Edaphochlamys debaryana]|uniref:Uncharacterized protein n=1 Tax=Edaphochlamys debaryana TaxID=47281 RepID=A0A835XI49_9CHLO|nr:hypothetical protein HYH03_017637 [Edaphochlamys debaryana]|eukprot:KAG2483532.1 hypothetical protein HYH03_017637 [Edaphochlamys debaryana]